METEAGARSCSSDTGAMAGPDYVYQGLFEQTGIIRAEYPVYPLY
jgi:acetyltransferase